jgi:hypothetical protein
MMLTLNLVGHLASGLLVRMGLRMRRGDDSRHNPTADEML